jgi:transglutaminase-like putative cysteine protease
MTAATRVSATNQTPPRPLASYAIVLVSAAALVLTGQVSTLAIAIHAVAVIVSLRLRNHPRAWQRNATVLNAGLLGSIGFSLSLWLRGDLALLALAHFAHLAQALQLLDARSRRSDFLLVALALFQIVLAANLTDSILFPPLLLAFLVATVWTLVVHTLWMETIAAGEAWSPQRAFAPRLLRTTLLASAGTAALALVIFLFLPRLHAGALGSRGGIGGAAAGFSDRVSLGDIGRIRRDPAIALRIETLRGVAKPPEQAYYRGLAFDHFDGRHWSVTQGARDPLGVAADLGVRVGSSSREPDLVQRILREPVESGVLFGAARPLEIEGGIGRIERDRNGGLYAPESSEDRVQYVVESETHLPTSAELRDDRALAPERGGERYLEMPALSPALFALTEQIMSGAGNDADRVSAVERWLREKGRYSDTPPAERADDPRSPIEHFVLENTEGHCEYFASAMVMMLRSQGIPARLVNGFAGGRDNEFGGFVEVSRSDAHAWAEVSFEHAGWVRFDPTPPDLRMRAAHLGMLAQLRDVAGAAEHWWYQHVVEFDRSAQLRALRSGWLAWQQWRGERATPTAIAPRAPHSGWRQLPWLQWARPAVAALLGATLIAGLVRWRRRSARRGSLPVAYGEALRLLEEERGLVRDAALPARDFARRAARVMPPAAAAAFWTLTEDYLRQRFGGHRPAAPRRALRALRDSLRA